MAGGAHVSDPGRWRQGAALRPNACLALSRAPFGVDPEFNPGSRLFIPELNSSDYYTKEELNSRGVPLGFFARPMRGYPDGFPVLLHSEASAKKALLDTEYLVEGVFVDDDTVQARERAAAVGWPRPITLLPFPFFRPCRQPMAPTIACPLGISHLLMHHACSVCDA